MENESSISRQQNAEQDFNNVASDLTGKQRGELAELAFMLKASSLGFGVAKPWGDSQQYDFILSRAQRVWRVQVKSTACVDGQGYRLSVHRHSKQAYVSYTSKEIEILIAHVVPLQVWYVIPVQAIEGRKSLCLYPCGVTKCGGRFEKYREAWHLMLSAPDPGLPDAGPPAEPSKDALE
jgi:hypothetical protein